MMERAVPRQNYDIFSNREQIGRVTSGTQSPSLNKGIGLGYVKVKYANPGTKIYIDIRGRKKSATIMKPPLYNQGTVNLYPWYDTEVIWTMSKSRDYTYINNIIDGIINNWLK